MKNQVIHENIKTVFIGKKTQKNHIIAVNGLQNIDILLLF